MSGHATLNRVYRMVWSVARQCWMAVAETARGRGKQGRARALLPLAMALSGAALAQQAPPAPTQLPTGGKVVGGAASIGQSGARMDIQQGSARAAIDWQSFNVGAQAQVNFQQPSAASVMLNRVLDTQASQIHGRISANGQVFLSNPNGVYFAPGAQVDVGGLVATTHSISTADFMAGKNIFSRDGATGSVVNDGQLSASLGGYIALLAPEVRNGGIVLAQQGTAALAAGDQIELQFAGSRNLTGLLVSASTLRTLVENRHAVQAPGGLVVLSAQAADRLQGGVVRNSGTLEATGLASRGGKVVLDGGAGLVDNAGRVDVTGAQGGGQIAVTGDRMLSGGSLMADGGGGRVDVALTGGLVETAAALTSAQGGGGVIRVDGGSSLYGSGRYRADGTQAGQQGGRISVTADDMVLMGAQFSARGDAGGGSILVGGGYQGRDAGVRNATATTVGKGVTFDADATRQGHGGTVVVWSDGKTVFGGDLRARGGAQGGNGGTMEVSGKQSLYFGGTATAYAARGVSGTLLLDPKDLYIDADLSGQLELRDPHPVVGGTFGASTTALTSGTTTLTPTGYVAVTNPTDTLGGSAAGAVYLFRQSDQALISTLYGGNANDRIGSSGVTSLANGNFVVRSPFWDTGKGAVTWGHGTTGWGVGASVAVSAANSLVGSLSTHTNSQGSSVSDGVGGTAIRVLSNGNYLVLSSGWSDSRGAVTFGNGTTGVSGAVSASNSLVGSTALSNGVGEFLTYKYGDQIGGNVTVLANDNYMVVSSGWNRGVGAAALGSGTSGLTGVVSASNALVGDSTRSDATGNGLNTDKFGFYTQALNGTEFLVYSTFWNVNRGAITWFDGVNPVTGQVSAANSMVGNANDLLGVGGVRVLASNNAYVIGNYAWNNSTGAATWVPFGTNVKDVVIASNGVRGGTTGDAIGSRDITVLDNGDYVLSSPNFNVTRGASTLVDGTTGLTKVSQQGVASAANSLVGGQVGDQVGSNGILRLTGNGNYAVLSPYWANGGNAKAGAVTWSSGTAPTVGPVSSANSLVGSSSNDRIGSHTYNSYNNNDPTTYVQEGITVTALADGDYAVASPMFNGTRGAVTWVSGSSGATANGVNTLSAANSLLGSTVGDFVGGFLTGVDVIGPNRHYDTISNGITALGNGSFVVVSNYWRNGSVLRAGAVSWSAGDAGATVGAVGSGNSLVGSTLDDRVGTSKNNAMGITQLLGAYDVGGNQLYTGNYVVNSARWDNGAIADAGAATWGSGSALLTGTISNSNSVLGTKTYTDSTGWNITALPMGGNYLINDSYWNHGAVSQAGAVSFVDGSTGRLSDYAANGNRNIVSSANSLVGSSTNDRVGSTLTGLSVRDVATGKTLATGNYVVRSTLWDNGALADAGAVTWGSGTTGVSGTISTSNSLIGSKAGDQLGAGTRLLVLGNGDYVVANPNVDVDGVAAAGAVAWVDGTTGRLSDYAARGNQNLMSAANSIVGSHANDRVGQRLLRSDTFGAVSSTAVSAITGDNGFFIFSDLWSCSVGAVTWIDSSRASGPITGVVGPGNSAVGNPNNSYKGALATSARLSRGQNDTGFVSFSGDRGHVVLINPTMPAQPDFTPGSGTLFGDAATSTLSMAPDYLADVLKTGTGVTLQASNDIFIKSAIDATGGTVGGGLTMQAGRSITVLGRIVTGNRDLSMVANESVTNGVVDAQRDSGTATISMGRDLRGQPVTIDAGSGHVSIRMAASSDKTNNQSGSISLNSINGATITVLNQGNGSGSLPDLTANCCGYDLGTRTTNADVILNAGAVLGASAAGDAVRLSAARNFVNNSGNGAGTIALSNPAARWLVYSATPGGNTYGNLNSGNTAVWSSTYNGASPTQTGNRYLFAFQPTITVGTQDVSKIYGEDLTSGTALVDRVVSLTGAQTGVSGAFLGDTVSTALSGGITASSVGAAATAGVAGGPYTVTVDLSGATGNNGYAVSLGSNTPRSLTVQAKTLTASLTGVGKVYDGTATALLVNGNFTLDGLVGSDSFTVGQTGGLFNASGVTASSVSASLNAGHLTAVGGTLASNYVLPTTASGSASITPKTLTATINGVSKTYDGTTGAMVIPPNYQLGGLVSGESISVMQALVQFNAADVLLANSVSTTLSSGSFMAGSGTSLANYVLPTSASGAASITPKTLTASLTGGISKTYDGSTDALLGSANFSLGGFVGSQSASVTQTAGSYDSRHVASASTATATLASGDFVAGSGTTLSNYVLPTSASGAASITPATLTASVSGTPTRSYDGSSTATLGALDYSLGGLASIDAITVTQTSGSYDSRHAGARTVGVTLGSGDFVAGSGTQLSDYVLPTSASGAGQINALALTLTAGPVSKTYDGGLGYTAQAGDLSALSAQLLGGDTVTAASIAYLDRNAGNGNKAVALNGVTLADGNGGNNYTVTLAGNSTSTILQRTLYVGATGIDRVYDTGTLASVTLSDNRISGDLLNLSYGSASFGDKNAGIAKTVSVAGIGLTGTHAGNYLLAGSTATTTADITPALLQVTGVSVVNRAYDTTLTAALAGTARVTPLGSDVVTLGGTGVGSYADKNVGSDKAVTVSGYTIGDTNYVLVQPQGLSGTVTPAVLDLSGYTVAVAKTYDGTLLAQLTGTPTVSGFGGEVVNVVGTGTGSFADPNAGTGKAVTVAGLASSDPNYAIGQQPGLAGSIAPKQLTMGSVSALTKTYDGTADAQIDTTRYVLNGLVGSESIAVSQSAGTFDSKNAGSRTVSVALSGGDFSAGSGTLLGNYLLPTSATGTGTITPLAVMLTAGSVSKTYDGGFGYTTQSGDLSALSAQLLGGDTVTAASIAYLDRNAGNGNKAVALNGVTLADGNGGGNYTVTLAGNSTSTILQRTLYVGATGIDRVYDTGTLASVTLSDNRISGDLLNLSYGSASFGDKNAGTGKAISVAGIGLTGMDAGNYLLASNTATTTADITPALLQVTGVSVLNRAYDTTLTAALAGTARVTPLGSDVVTLGGTGVGSYADKNVGVDKAVTVSGYTISDTNYLLVQPTGLSGTVTPAVLNLGGYTSAVTKTYDGTVLAQLSGTPTVSGFGGEVITVLGTGTGSFADPNAGTGKAVTVAGLTSSDPNYAIGQQPGLAGSIAPRQLTVGNVSALTKTYDGTAQAQIDTASYLLDGLVGSESIAVSQATGSLDSKNAGTRTVTVALAAGDFSAGSGTWLGNYLLPTSATGTGMVTPRAVTLAAGPVSKVYDGTVGYATQSADLSALTAQLLGGDTVTAATLAYLDKNAGAGNKTLLFQAATLSDGNGGGNYSITLAGNNTSTVTPRTLHVTATGVNRVYDTTTLASVLLDDDRVSGDLLSLSSSSASFGDKNAGTGKAISVAGIGLTGMDAGNYLLASNTATTTADITPALLQVTGVSVLNRAYDTTLTAALAGTAQITPLGSDVVVLGGTGVGSYADKNAGSDKAVTVSGYTISDANYQLLQPTGLSGTVTPAVLNLGGYTSAVTKTYDGTVLAQLSGTPTVSGLGGEAVTVLGTGTGSFADKNAGTGKAVTVAGLTSSDPNYAIGQQPGLVGDIVPATVVVAGVQAVDRLYDGSTVVALRGTAQVAAIAGDSLAVAGTPSANVADAEAGDDKAVTVSGYVLSGADAGNYRLQQPQGLTVDIAAVASEPVRVPPPVVVAPPPLPGVVTTPELAAPTLTLMPQGSSSTLVASSVTPGITVALVTAPVGQQSGQIAVSVPRQLVDAGGGFAFPVPNAVVQAAVARGVAIRATAADGSALPSWISYSAESRSFVATRVPAGGLPVQVLLLVDDQRYVLVISEAS